MEILTDFFLNVDQYLIDIVAQYRTWTYAILFLVIFCETGLVVMAFLPGDSLLFVAGALTAMPCVPLEINSLTLLLFLAAILGDTCNYAVGRYFGQRYQNRFIKPTTIEKTQEFFRRYGGKTIIIARFLPLIRTFAPFVAGMGRMDYHRFTIFNIIGAAIWTGLLCYAGYFFGDLPFVKHNAKLLIVTVAIISMIPAAIEYIKVKYEKK